MTKINWERDTKKRRSVQTGTEKAYMLEIPPSHEELAAAAVPGLLRETLRKFLRKVARAELDRIKMPKVPSALGMHLQKHINREGGVLGCAKWFPEYDLILAQERSKRERPKASIRRHFLHKIAKAQAKGVSLDSLLPPPELIVEVSKFEDLAAWAKSRPGYSGILNNAETYERGRKRREAVGNSGAINRKTV